MQINSKDKCYENADQIEGRYANLFNIGHNAFEFVLEFGQLYSETSQKQIHTRVITGPAYAKALLRILKDSIDQYEKAFGIIPEEDE